MPNKLYKVQVKRTLCCDQRKGMWKQVLWSQKSHNRKTVPLMIMKPNNLGLVEKGTVRIYDKPLSYIKLVTYGKSSASSTVKASLLKPSAFKWLPNITVFCTSE